MMNFQILAHIINLTGNPPIKNYSTRVPAWGKEKQLMQSYFTNKKNKKLVRKSTNQNYSARVPA